MSFRICFVCLGNICRSPIAEVVMRSLLEEKGRTLKVREKGHAEGISTLANGARRKIDGDTFSEELLDLEGGTIVSGEYEWTVAIVDEPPSGHEPDGVGRTRIRAERGEVAQRGRR